MIEHAKFLDRNFSSSARANKSLCFTIWIALTWKVIRKSLKVKFTFLIFKVSKIFSVRSSQELTQKYFKGKIILLNLLTFNHFKNGKFLFVFLSFKVWLSESLDLLNLADELTFKIVCYIKVGFVLNWSIQSQSVICDVLHLNNVYSMINETGLCIVSVVFIQSIGFTILAFKSITQKVVNLWAF